MPVQKLFDASNGVDAERTRIWANRNLGELAQKGAGAEDGECGEGVDEVVSELAGAEA
jgi:hypothetical protein